MGRARTSNAIKAERREPENTLSHIIYMTIEMAEGMRLLSIMR